MQQIDEQKNIKTVTITINDTDYVMKKNNLNSLLQKKNDIESKIFEIEKSMSYHLDNSRNAKKGVGLLIPEKQERRDDSRLESNSCSCRRYDYCSCSSQVYVNYTTWKTIPAHYASYVPDTDARNQSVKALKALGSEYFVHTRNLTYVRTEITSLENNINKIVSSDNICNHVNSFKDSNLLSTRIKIKSLESLLIFIKNLSIAEDVYIDIDLGNNRFDDNDAIAIANALKSIGRVCARLNINLSNNNIGNTGGKAIIDVLESGCRPVWLNINLSDNKINIPLLNPNDYSLLSAVKANDVETVEILLKAGPGNDQHWSCDAAGNSPLHYAALNGNKEIVDLLIDHQFSLSQQNKEGKTPIQVCDDQKHIELIKFIVRKTQTDENDVFHYGSVLLSATERNDLESIKILLAAGAGNNKNWKNNKTGNSSLHYAIENGNAEAVNLLLNAHFSLDKENKRGDTPLQLIAQRGGYIEDAIKDAREMYFSLPDYIVYCQKYYQHKMELDDFTLIYAQCLFYKYFSMTNKNEASDITNKINWLIEYVLYRGKKEKIPEKLYFEIANFYFTLSEIENRYYIESIHFLILSANDDNGIKKVKAACYLKLMGQESLNINVENFSLGKLKECVGPEKFSCVIQSSGLIDELKPDMYNHSINNELAELYYLMGDFKNLSVCSIRDHKNIQISQMLSQLLMRYSVKCINQYIDVKKKEKAASIFFYHALGENRAKIYLMLLADPKRTFTEKALILLALFYNNDAKDLKINCANALDFDHAEDARENFLGLIKKELGSTFEEKRGKLNIFIEEITVTANSNEAIPEAVLDKKFKSLMAMLEFKSEKNTLSIK